MKKLFYTKPAAEWNEALPIGNGRLGAMIFGNPARERLQLNEDSVWYGGPIDRVNPAAAEHLDQVRQLILEGRIPEAEKLLEFAFSGTPQSQRPYQSLGDLTLTFSPRELETSSYVRELNLENAIHRVAYTLDNPEATTISRESFASYPDHVIALHIKSSTPAMLNVFCLLTRERFYDHSWALDDCTVAMDGNLGKGGSDFVVVLKALAVDGTVRTMGEHLIVEGAGEVLLLLTAATGFRHEDPLQACIDTLMKASRYSYDALKKRHVEDYRKLFSRVDFTIESSEDRSMLPTDERLQAFSMDHPDKGMVELLYHYGRYLLISSSREGSLPANLQGIWNPHMLPPWDSKYTININTEMNYWPALPSNLAECQLPLFDLLERLVWNGRSTAERMYKCRGFVAHHNTDIWADTAPQDIYIPASYWVMGGAWLSLHIWQHYLYTQDIDFLKKYYYVLEEAALFFEDFLIAYGDYLLTCPSVSPENTYRLEDGTEGRVCAGPSMDNEILLDLFSACIGAGEILHIPEEKLTIYRDLRAKLPPIRIGKHGQIMEWLEDYEEVEPGHRHISHLFALYPSDRISRDQTPDLAEAAKVTLERRLKNGGGHTGWSMAWIINMYARLWDAEACFLNIRKFIVNSVLPNGFGTHPPFQIDGNFGFAAAVVEMLVQSNPDRVILLPALPKAWADGKLTGIKIVGNAEVDVEWKNGCLDTFTIRTHQALDTTILFKEGTEAVFSELHLSLPQESQYHYKNKK